MVMDMHTGRVLHAHDADKLVYPASLTKLMTIYMVFEAIDSGRLDWSTRIRMSEEAARRPPSKLGLKPGETIAVRDAVRILIVKSANDVAAAIGEHLAGSEEAFARRMTATARRIGMRNTVFRNASGLPHAEQLTTARDMLRLAQRLYDGYPKYYPLFRIRRFVYRGREFRNHNGLLGRFPGTEGMKTGYTRASGFNLLASVRKNRRHVMGVVFGGRSAGERNTRMRGLIRTALTRASPTRSILRARPQLVAERTQPKVEEPRELTTVELRRRQLEEAREQEIARLAPRPVAPPSARTSAPAGNPPPGTGIPAVSIARVRTVDVRSTRDGASDAARSSDTVRAPEGRPMGTSLGSAAVRQPSTLDAQARQLAAATPPSTSWDASRRSTLGGNPSARRYEVQVGAYVSKDMARDRLAQVQARMREVLSDVQPHAQPVAIGKRRVYRARFVGFDSEGATAACTQMRSQSIDCFVARGS
jgi:D-alanyl-D-alanine carboxypeptidase